MGMIYRGVPKELVRRLQAAHGLTDFFETGSQRGNTAKWAAGSFQRVVTVERAPRWHAIASEAGRERKNIEFVLGDSREELRKRAPSLPDTTLFWLDAHFSGGDSYGAKDECPLLDEIRALTEAGGKRFILVDDARLFLYPPPAPHALEQWPTMEEVLRELRLLGKGQYSAVFEDVVISVPAEAKPTVVDYCRDMATKPWNHWGYFWETFKLD